MQGVTVFEQVYEVFFVRFMNKIPTFSSLLFASLSFVEISMHFKVDNSLNPPLQPVPISTDIAFKGPNLICSLSSTFFTWLERIV